MRDDPREHLGGMAIGREHRIEDVFDRAVAHDERQAREEDLAAGGERRQRERARQLKSASDSSPKGGCRRSAASRWWAVVCVESPNTAALARASAAS
jgi:hypothetical protein